MALIKCPECSKENVSDTAVSCPNCGYGIKAHFNYIKKQERIAKVQNELQIKKIKKKLIISSLILMVIFVFIIIIIDKEKAKVREEERIARNTKSEYEEILEHFNSLNKSITEYINLEKEVDYKLYHRIVYSFQVTSDDFSSSKYLSDEHKEMLKSKFNSIFSKKNKDFLKTLIKEGSDDYKSTPLVKLFELY